MTNYLNLLVYLMIIALVIALYVWRRRHVERGNELALEEAVVAGMTEPPSLHPVIDLLKCIGCGACAKACPEQALGIINGKAVLINAAECIGHGACKPACPVDGIELVFGTEKRGIDIPSVSPEFQSNVPGIFIAGELGGMGLVRKAAEQGQQAIASIKKRVRPGAKLDVVIVGAGPSGLAAGLAAVQHKLKYVLLEQEDALGGTVYHYPRNKITMAGVLNLPIIGKLKMGEIKKEALLEFWQGIVKKTGLKIRFRERMESIEPTASGFIVKSSRASYEATSVLLTIGRRGTPRKLGIPGEEQAKVVYRLIDPEQYRDMKVLVVGGGDSAIEAALAVAEQPGKGVVSIAYRSEAFSRLKPKNRDRLDRATADGLVEVLLGTTPSQIGERDVTLKKGNETSKLGNDAVIVCAGGILPTELLKKVASSSRPSTARSELQRAAPGARVSIRKRACAYRAASSPPPRSPHRRCRRRPRSDAARSHVRRAPSRRHTA